MILIGVLIALAIGVGIVAIIIVKMMLIAALAMLAGIYVGSYFLVTDLILPNAAPGWQVFAAAILGTGFLWILSLIFGPEKLQFWQPRQKPWWHGIKTPRYMPCPCGSGVPFYRCHEAMENERQKLRQRIEDAKQYAVSPEDSGN